LGPRPEKLQDLDPIHAQDWGNDKDEEFPAFPTPIGLGAGRSAYYV